MSALRQRQFLMAGNSAPVVYTTLNPADRSANVALSGGNLVATALINGAGIVRSIAPITGKAYFEAVWDYYYGVTAVIAAGVARSTHSLTASLGYSNPDGWAMWGDTTGARHNGVTAIDSASAAFDVIGFAVDPIAGKMWISRNGAWLQGNPATDTSPIWTDLSGTLYAAACPWSKGSSGTQVTMRFDPSTFSNPAPAGFSPLTS